jgi:hypothetical protein
LPSASPNPTTLAEVIATTILVSPTVISTGEVQKAPRGGLNSNQDSLNAGPFASRGYDERQCPRPSTSTSRTRPPRRMPLDRRSCEPNRVNRHPLVAANRLPSLGRRPQKVQ